MKWPVHAIGDVFEVARGGSPRPIQNFLTDKDDGLNWIMIGDAKDGSKYITETKKRIKPAGLKKSRMVHEGDFLLTNSMSFGHPYILKTSGCIHDGWLVLSPREKNISRDFFYYLLGSDALYNEFSKRAAGAVVKNLNTEIVKSVQISLPPLAEQKRIAAILDAADALRAKRREALAQLDALLQSTFLTLFGDPVTNPMGWPIRPLSDGVKSFEGGRNIMPIEGERSDRIRVLKVSAVTSGEYRPDESKSFAEEEDVPLHQIVRKGDLLISRANTAALVGAVCYVWETNGLEMMPDKLWRFCWTQPNRIEPFFMLHIARSAYFRQQLIQRATGTSGSMKNIGKAKMLEIPIPVPPLPLQQKFAAIVESIERQKTTQRTHLTELDALFAALQHRAFRGEL
jgi:type I restriction enzyme S subunit